MNIITNILKRHPDCVASVFIKHGYSKTPMTEESVIAIAQLKGKAFIDDLTTEVSKQYDENGVLKTSRLKRTMYEA
jgi:arsenate reductase-like glutaredoxin family protein